MLDPSMEQKNSLEQIIKTMDEYFLLLTIFYLFILYFFIFILIIDLF